MTPRRHPIVAAAALALALSGAGPSAWAEGLHKGHTPNVVRPFVMLALDTSGSMEWETGSNKLPHCAGSLTDDTKTRWISVVEVLTGSYKGFKCKEMPRSGDEAGYYIPHYTADSSAQNHDGLIELYGDEIEFGLMTMDSFPSPATDGSGMWSYPDAAQPADPHGRYTVSGAMQRVAWSKNATCTFDWNVGARHETAPEGRLVPHNWGGTKGKAHQSRNNEVRNQIKKVRPYWSSPVGPLLYDAYYYYTAPHRAVKAKKNGGDDCYADCRPRHVVLITDGLPNTDGQPECSFANPSAPPLDSGECPYPQAWQVARDMYTDGIQVHVVGFSALDTTGDVWSDTGAKTSNVDVLEHLGLWSYGGNTADCPLDPLGNPECTLFADDAAKLRAALGRVFDSIIQGTRARTRSATINTVVTVGSGHHVGQHQLFSSADVSAGVWEGNLERVTYRCNEKSSGDWEITLVDNVPAGTVFDYGDEGLDKLTIPPKTYNQRDIYTVDPSQAIYPNTAATGPRDFVRLDDAAITTTMLDVADANERDEVLSYMHGAEGYRDEARLGAIYHTTPVVVGPPTLELPLASYNVGPHVSAGKTYSSATNSQIGFRQLYAKRPHLIYAATMDGMVHAFNLDVDVTKAGIAGTVERWAFVPPMLLKRLKSNLLGQSFLMDGQLAVEDVRLYKSADGTAPDEWATVLVTGLRQGGGVRGYFALDVTAPEADPAASAPSVTDQAGSNGLGKAPDFDSNPYGRPKLLWEIESSSKAYPVSAAFETLDTYAGLGLTYSRPAFGTVLLNDGVRNGEIAVVFLPAGTRPYSSVNPNCTGVCTEAQCRTGCNDECRVDCQLLTGPEKTACENDCTASCNTQCSVEVGCGLYVVRASDGRLIRWLTPSKANCTVTSGQPDCNYAPSKNFDCQMTGSPVALGGLPGEATTRVFVGDSQGRLYRADLSDPNPSRWTLDPFFRLYHDGEDPQPIYEAPAVALDERGLVTLVFGTGDSDNLEDVTSVNRMASITEMFDGSGEATLGRTCEVDWQDVESGTRTQAEFELPTDCPGKVVFPFVNWVINFETNTGPFSSKNTGLTSSAPMTENRRFVTGERMMGSPVIFDNIAYFTTYVPANDPDDCCVAGYGRVLGVHMIGRRTTTGDVTDVIPSLDDSVPDIELSLMGENEIAYGASIVRQPSCTTIEQDPSTDEWTPDLRGASRAAYKLVVHNNTQIPPEIMTGEAPQTGFAEVELATPPVRCFPDSWASIFGL